MELADWSSGLVEEPLKKVLPDPAQLEKVYTKPAVDFQTAPGWREVAVEYSCIPDSMYPWDPCVMKAIRVLALDAVPMWVRWVFRSPQDTENPHDVVFGRHALGRSIDHQKSELDGFRCEMPTMPCQGLKFSKPNRIWFIHEGERPTERFVDLPGDYLPFDETLYLKVLDMSAGFRMTDKEYKEALREQFIHKPERERQKRIAANADDMEQRSKDWHSYADKIMKSISDVEIKEFMGRR